MAIDAPLTFEQKAGTSADSLIFVLSGPLTLRNMFDLQSALRGAPTPKLVVFDLTDVPYMDSAGMGLIVNHHVHCQARDSRLVVAGANNRVLDVFRVTRVDTVLALAPTAEAAHA
jgi:anti-sigma B factor antagonist